MRNMIIYYFIFFLCGISFSAYSQQSANFNAAAAAATAATDDSQYFQVFVKGVNQFAFDLYQGLQNKSENFIVSPYSIAVGMSMVGEGAQNETRDEIQKALHYSLNLSPLIFNFNRYLGANVEVSRQAQLSSIDAVWIQEGLAILPSFQIALKKNFEFVMQPVNFANGSQAISAINKWVSTLTKGKFNQIVSYNDIIRDTQFILTTGFYWKGEWLNAFDPLQTKRAPFLYRGHPFQVEMMKQSATYLMSQTKDSKVDLLQIPFKPIGEEKGQLSLVICLPKEGVELSAIQNELNAEQWVEWMNQLQAQPVEIFLPKFRVESDLDLNVVLKSLGIRKAFDSTADFSGISEKNKLHLDKVVHKISFEVDEKGSGRVWGDWPRKKEKLEDLPKFEVNRPFFFIIQEMNTRLILGIGKVERP